MISTSVYRNKLRAAFLGRAAGCTLGAPIEGWTRKEMEDYAEKLGIAFPLTDYIPEIPEPERVRYIYQTFGDYTRPKLDGVPCDDDIGYTLLSLFIAEHGGPDFTVNDVADMWREYITECYTAERVAMDNLIAGVSPDKAAEINNPYDEWIGADIRCDGYAYMAPANPAKAADMAGTDAYISHRNNGVYGSRYFAAVISSAFETGDVKTSLEKGLEYIPADCELAEGLKWALGIWDTVGDYKNAEALVDARYPGMSTVHTVNNACLTVFGLALGKKNLGKVISECVAMAHDCDCTAATAGSITGAAYGMDCIDEKWYAVFGDKVNSFFNGPRSYSINEILSRYEAMAVRTGCISE